MWAVRTINTLTRIPGISAIFLDLEFALHEQAPTRPSTRRTRRQRMDALLYARMHGQNAMTDDDEEIDIPWHQGNAAVPGDVVVGLHGERRE